MSPEAQPGKIKPVVSSNIYTVLVAVIFALVLATAGFVVYKCYFDYGTIFKIP